MSWSAFEIFSRTKYFQNFNILDYILDLNFRKDVTCFQKLHICNMDIIYHGMKCLQSQIAILNYTLVQENYKMLSIFLK